MWLYNYQTYIAYRSLYATAVIKKYFPFKGSIFKNNRILHTSENIKIETTYIYNVAIIDYIQ